MAKVKYFYDADTLSYRKIEKKKSDYFKRSIFLILGRIVSDVYWFCRTKSSDYNASTSGR